MATTPRDIIVAAYATNAANQPGAITTDETELLDLVNRLVRALFSEAASINPTYFGKRATVNAATPNAGWPVPADAEAVFRVETPGGVNVWVVPYDDRALDPDRITVFFLGRRYWPAGNVNDVTSGDLVFWYARQPVDAATIDSVIDPDFPDGMVGVLIGLVALYLDIKDRRLQDAEAQQGVREQWLGIWREHVLHLNAGETRLNDSPRLFHSPSLKAADG